VKKKTLLEIAAIAVAGEPSAPAVTHRENPNFALEEFTTKESGCWRRHAFVARRRRAMPHLQPLPPDKGFFA